MVCPASAQKPCAGLWPRRRRTGSQSCTGSNSTPGRISLDGTPLALGQLRGRLQALGAEDDLLLRAEATTPYGRYDEVLAEVRRAGITRLGTVGNERFATALD